MADTTPTATPPAAKGRNARPVAKTRAAPATKTVISPKKVAAVKTAKATKPAKVAKPRAKLVRDSFTMPQSDFDLIDVLKQRALDFKRPTKKSELLRAGLQVLAALPPAKLEQCLAKLVALKTGRPRKAG